VAGGDPREYTRRETRTCVANFFGPSRSRSGQSIVPVVCYVSPSLRTLRSGYYWMKPGRHVDQMRRASIRSACHPGPKLDVERPWQSGAATDAGGTIICTREAIAGAGKKDCHHQFDVVMSPAASQTFVPDSYAVVLLRENLDGRSDRVLDNRDPTTRS